MATIDLIVLGMVKQQPLSAYDIQKLVEYRNISRWVKISTPSIYKKVIQLENKGYIKSTLIKEGNKVEKAIYDLTDAGQSEFQRLMQEISQQPIQIFLDFNAVMVNLTSLAPEEQKKCIANIEENIVNLKNYLAENQAAKEHSTEIPETGLAVLQQQIILAEAIEKWLQSVKEGLGD
ncbi:PadR family transcriptional regulator [Enterococcus sp. AZ163]|uniref:PadR family transcriptional regulator n=1 Tax=Enterococcus sp. AZ163 TaxID=2774638 RepID=UPI003D2D8C68